MFQSGTDLLQSGPGSPVPVAVELLNKVKALPAVGSLYHDLIKNAKGIAFLTTWKAGVLYVGGQAGSGLVLAHLPDGSWSSPAFFKFHGVGGGLTLGVSRAETVIVLNSDQALAQYQSADFNFKFGAGLNVDYIKPNEAGEGVEGGGLAAKLETGNQDAFVFNFAKGLMVDLTITGGVTTSDAGAHSKVYSSSPGATPDQILSGSVPHPAQAEALYRALEPTS